MGKDLDDDAGSSGSDGAQQSLTSRYRVHFPLTDAGGHDLIQEARDVTEKYSHRTRNKYARRSPYQWAVAVLPILGWLPNYNVKSWLVADVAAGLSVAAMVVPQGLSYAKLAGLPQVWGLYGAFSPCIVYAAFGSSKQLAVGPVAVTSLLLGNTQHGLGSLAGVTFPSSVLDPATNLTVPYNPSSPGAFAPQQDAYNNAAHNVAFLAGLMYTVIGLLRLGWITQYLSQPVISGFMSGACITIAMSQVKYLMGLKIPRFDRLQDTCSSLVANLNYFNWREYVMGMSFIIILEVFKFVGRKHKRLFFLRALGPLTVTVMSIAIMNIWKLYEPGKGGPNGIYTVGVIPKGLPGYTGNKFFPFVGGIGQTFGLSIVVCLIDLTESISIARALALKNRYELQPTQELLAIGYANIVGALFNSYTTTGSFSRSAVNNSCGARTPLASMVSGLAVMVVLLCLTTVFKNMSNNAQGAIIISGVITLFDYKTAIFLARSNILDFVVWVATFLGVTFAGVEIGIAIGVGLSFLYVGLKIGFPHTAVLGRLPGTNLYRNVKQYPEARTIPGILIARVDAPFYFASVHTIRDMLERYEKRAQAEAAEHGTRLSYIVIDLSSVAEVDATAVYFLFDVVRTHREAELADEATGQKTPNPIQILFANPSKQVVREFELADLVNYAKAESIFVDVSDAVAYAEHALLSGQKLEDHTLA